MVESEVLTKLVYNGESTSARKPTKVHQRRGGNKGSAQSLKLALEETDLQTQALEEEVQTLQQELAASKTRITKLWRLSCSKVQE